MSTNLLQVTAAYKPAYVYGGPTMSVAKLCEAIVAQKVNLKVLTTTANGKTELPVKPKVPQLIDGVNVTYFERWTKDHTHFSPSLLFALVKNIRQAKAEKGLKLIIHIHAWWNLVSILSCLLAKWYQIPVVLSPRGMLTAYTLGNKNVGVKSLIHTLLGKKLLSYCHIHATSEKERDDISTYVSPKSITVISNLVDLPQQIPNLSAAQSDNNTFKLLFLSRIEEKKGLELLFEALKLTSIKWTLSIAGTGETQYIDTLKTKLAALGIADQINWLGHVSNENKFDLLAASDMMILTSFNENFANVVVESLSVGTPVLLSNEVGLAAYVAKESLGWIADLDPNAIIEKIEMAFVDQDKRAKIRYLAPTLIKEHFSVPTLVRQYLNFYETVS